MNEQEAQSDRNLERLIRMSCGPEARLSPLAREQFRLRLFAALREKSRTKDFPAGFLALFSGLVLLLAAMSLLPLWDKSLQLLQGFGSNPLELLVFANLACLPIACIVIILRRKSCLSA